MQPWERTLGKLKDEADRSDGFYHYGNMYFSTPNTLDVLTQMVGETWTSVSSGLANRLARKFDVAASGKKPMIVALNDEIVGNQCAQVMKQLKERFPEDTWHLVIPRHSAALRGEARFQELIGESTVLKIARKPGNTNHGLAFDEQGRLVGELDISLQRNDALGTFVASKFSAHKKVHSQERKIHPGPSLVRSFGDKIVLLCMSNIHQLTNAPSDRGGAEFFHEFDHALKYQQNVTQALREQMQPHAKLKNQFEVSAFQVENAIWEERGIAPRESHDPSEARPEWKHFAPGVPVPRKNAFRSRLSREVSPHLVDTIVGTPSKSDTVSRSGIQEGIGFGRHFATSENVGNILPLFVLLATVGNYLVGRTRTAKRVAAPRERAMTNVAKGSATLPDPDLLQSRERNGSVSWRNELGRRVFGKGGVFTLDPSDEHMALFTPKEGTAQYRYPLDQVPVPRKLRKGLRAYLNANADRSVGFRVGALTVNAGKIIDVRFPQGVRPDRKASAARSAR